MKAGRLLLLTGLVVIFTLIYVKNKKQKPETNEFTESVNGIDQKKAQEKLSFFQTLPNADVEIDTIQTVVTSNNIGQGVILTALSGQTFMAIRKPLKSADSVKHFIELTQRGFAHGNYAYAKTNNKIYTVTAKHLFEEVLDKMTGEWKILPEDCMYGLPSADKIASQKIVPPVDNKTNLAGRKVVVDGYRFYIDKPYALHFRFFGTLQKVSAEFISTMFPVDQDSRQLISSTNLDANQMYVLRIPIQYAEDVKGLSGSGVFTLNNKGVIDSIAGVQSLRIRFGSISTDTRSFEGSNITEVGILIQGIDKNTFK